jgi:hypothetical protein
VYAERGMNETKPTRRTSPIIWAMFVLIVVCGVAMLFVDVIPDYVFFFREIDRPWYSESLVDRVESQEMKKRPDPESRRRIVAEVVSTYGPQYQSGFEWRSLGHSPSRADSVQSSATLLQLMNEADQRFPKQTVMTDRHIAEVFLALSSRSYDVYNPRDRAWLEDADRLAVACMKRLIGKGFDADIRRYCESRGPLSPFYGEEMKAILGRVK